MRIRFSREWDFMGRRRAFIALSVTLMLLSLVSLATRGLNFGIDFTGGALIEVGYPDTADLPAVREALAAAGFDDAQVQNFGTARDALIRLRPDESLDGATLGETVMTVLSAADPDVSLRRVEFVGPQVGEDLREQGGLAMLFALLLILAYVAFRFQWKFALGSVAALFHDVLLTLGFFSVLQLPFDLSVLAAVLAVIGYSLNDTIVVFDRIRENFRQVRKGEAADIMNHSINQTLSRTLITSGTTLLVLLALFLLGGEAIRPFSQALIVRVLVGTYSSIYVASATALQLDVSLADLAAPPKREGDEHGAVT